MIELKIKFGNGSIVDSYSQYGFIFLSADSRFEAPLKEMATTSYPEENGVHCHEVVARDTFEYTVNFLVEGTSLSEDINKKIQTFNAAMYTASSATDSSTTLRTLKRVIIYSTYKGVKIEGLPIPVEEPTEFWRDHNGQKYGAAQVAFKIKVDDPSKCNFDYSE